MSPSLAGVSTPLIDLIQQSLAFELSSCDLTPVRSPRSTGWRTLPALVVAHMPQGTDLLEFDGHPPMQLNRGQALCVRAGIRHRFTVTSAHESISRWAHLQFTVFSSLDLMALLDPPFVIGGRGAERIGECCMELVASRSDPPLRAMSRRVAAAFALLDAIVGACPAPRLGLETIGEARRLGPALACIEARLDDAELGVRDLARSLGLSTSRLHALFTRVLGLSPTAYLRRRRMAKAEGLLVGSDLLVREIAARCGWADEFHFSRLFKHVHAVSPLGYRQRRTQAGI